MQSHNPQPARDVLRLPQQCRQSSRSPHPRTQLDELCIATRSAAHETPGASALSQSVVGGARVVAVGLASSAARMRLMREATAAGLAHHTQGASAGGRRHWSSLAGAQQLTSNTFRVAVQASAEFGLTTPPAGPPPASSSALRATQSPGKHQAHTNTCAQAEG
jgi:hypothetical protein